MPTATARRPGSRILAVVVGVATGQHGAISREQLVELGATPAVLRRWVAQGFLSRETPDVFLVGAVPPSWERDLSVGLLQLGDGALVSHRAAAVLHGFDTFTEAVPEYTVPPTSRQRQAPGIVHSTARVGTDDERTMVGAFACTSPARTIFDLAALVPTRRLEHVIDGCLRDGTLAANDLDAMLSTRRVSGRTGVRAFEEALAVSSGPVAHSVLERRFLRLVADFGLPMPQSQVTVHDAAGFVGRVDFLFEERVIAEVDGHGSHATRAQRQHDADRRNRLEALGYLVLVFTFEDVRDRPEVVVRRLWAALRRARSFRAPTTS